MLLKSMRTLLFQVAIWAATIGSVSPAWAQTLATKVPPESARASPAVQVTRASVEAGGQHAQGKAHFGRGEYMKAIDAYSKAISLSPSYSDAWHDRGLAQMGRGDFKSAVADFSKAIDLFGSAGASRPQANSYVDRARALTHLYRTAEALADYDRARVVFSASPYLHAQRAFTHWRARNFDDADADASRAVQLEPFSQTAYLARGIRGMVHAERGQYERAATEFRELLKLAPDHRTAVVPLRSALMLGRNQVSTPIRIVRRADPACEPDCPEWIAIQGAIERGQENQLAQVLDRLGDKRLPVLVDSPGGNVDVALAMGRKIREFDLDVAVARTEFAPDCAADQSCQARLKGGRALGTPSDIATICSSACVYLLAAGANRSVGPMSLVGLHQISFYRTYSTPPTEERLKRDQLEGRVIVSTPSGPRLLGAVKDATYVQTRSYYSEMGMDESIMRHLLAAPSQGMHWLSADELVATRLITGTGFIAQTLVGKSVAPNVVTLAAPKASAPATSNTELFEGLHRELVRLGCIVPARDDKPSATSLQRGFARYTALAGGSAVGAASTQATLDALRQHAGIACPETCPKGTTEREGFCVRTSNGKSP